ncbi:MAG TPA: hypothetical protein DEQ02_00150 [Ruminococcaceae bacterium]|nr:hypothetical protein [Oscillospiraceae bacterium]
MAVSKNKERAPAGARGGSRSRGKPPGKAGGNRQLWAVVLFASAVFFLCVALIKGSNIWSALHNFMFGIFGVCAYIWPFLLGYVAIICALDHSGTKVGNKIWESALMLVFIGAAIDIFSQPKGSKGFFAYISGQYSQGMVKNGGGFLGAVLGYPLGSLFGKTGAGIIIILLIFVLLMFITGTTLIALFKTIWKPVKHIEKTAKRRQERYAEEEAQQQRKPQFAIDLPTGYENEFEPYKQESKPEKISDKQKHLIDAYRSEEIITGRTKKSESKKKNAPVDVPLDEIISKAGTTLPDEVAYTPKKGKLSSSEQAAIAAEIRQTAGIRVDSADAGAYRYPPVSLLDKPKKPSGANVSEELKSNAARLVETLRSFGVETRIIDISRGPAVTRYELQPSAGVKISKITNLADDIALNLATAGVRIEAPIPNKAAVGIEVPNKITSVVNMRDLLESSQFLASKSRLSVALGKDIAGNVTLADIAKMPHVLIAGATGSGKSVCINSIIISLLYKASPEEVKLLMIDPKVVELGIYNGIPHLLVPVVTDPRKAAGALGWAVTEMLKRYKLFADANVRDLKAYNRLCERKDGMEKLPEIVIIIDELADLMMAAPNEVEDSICRLAQMARAAGMHLVIATQRPSVDVITGIIKANIPSRIAFAVSSQVDSRTILDMGGADKLLGKGDMLFSPVGSAKPVRVQGCFVSDKEVESVVEFVKGREQRQQYDEEIMEEIEKQAVAEKGAKRGAGADETDTGDEMLPQAVECVVEAGQASTSLLQRKLKLGYARAARIMDEMEQRGIIGPFEGAKPRQVLLSRQQWLEMRARND